MTASDIAAALLGPALGVALSPFPVIAAVLVLTGPRAATAGPALAAGFTAGLAALSALAFALIDGSGRGDGVAAAVLRLALGAALLAAAVSKWRKRPRPGEVPPVPGWMAALHDIAPGRAFATGAALGGINPKNIGFAAAAAASVAGLGPRGAAGAALAFALMGSGSVLLATLARLLAGAAATGPLDALRGFMVRHGGLVLAAIFALIGAKLVLAGLSGLTG